MAELLTGELTCQVHLSATVRSLMNNGGAILAIREIQRNTVEVRYYCTCRMAAEFHVENVGRVDTDQPFPIFREL